ncbi:MAG: hypothetical protein JWO31_2065, partial [Phycisphaerales bacterium]|nr:hypothetical protein [Phycisphaerales bacterium]
MTDHPTYAASSNATALPGVPHHATPASRREFLARSGAGFGAVAMAAMLAGHPLAAGAADAATALDAAGPGPADPLARVGGRPKPSPLLSPLAARAPHYPARAKNVIFLFMEGGPSHLDLFDPKPALAKLAGKPLPASFGSIITAMGEYGSPILADQRTWGRYGSGGTWMSDWVPHLHPLADEIAVVRSCVADGINHSGGVCQMNTGSVLAGRP